MWLSPHSLKMENAAQMDAQAVRWRLMTHSRADCEPMGSNPLSAISATSSSTGPTPGCHTEYDATVPSGQTAVQIISTGSGVATRIASNSARSGPLKKGIKSRKSLFVCEFGIVNLGVDFGR